MVFKPPATLTLRVKNGRRTAEQGMAQKQWYNSTTQGGPMPNPLRMITGQLVFYKVFVLLHLHQLTQHVAEHNVQ